MMMKKKYTLILLLFLFLQGSNVFSASVDTVETYSVSMQKKIKAVVVTPNSYSKGDKFPVVYLLHGYGGKYSSWIKLAPAISDLADRYQMMIVSADGSTNSWYFDSPVNPAWKYETYVATELVTWVDDHYHTIKNRNARAITGLSMGGHGAFYLAFKHQDTFGAAGSTSGGVDIRPFPGKWGIADRLGSYAEKPERWEANTVTNMLHLLSPGKLALIFDCGTEDFFYGVNVALHQKLSERNIPHDFISRPGGHTSEYWANAIIYQLQYFSAYFRLGNQMK